MWYCHPVCSHAFQSQFLVSSSGGGLGLVHTALAVVLGYSRGHARAHQGLMVVNKKGAAWSKMTPRPAPGPPAPWTPKFVLTPPCIYFISCILVLGILPTAYAGRHQGEPGEWGAWRQSLDEGRGRRRRRPRSHISLTPPWRGHVHFVWRKTDGISRAAPVGVDVKAILTLPCIFLFCVENHQRKMWSGARTTFIVHRRRR